ncbi:fungal-specific transcription factor domain-containing protein [Kalaharituber pfeilii]|nr:fungal-specific transcription factor domain-containing protein [Kalaharituber pfeilii]
MLAQPPAVVNPASAPRKRRRRAPATGAAEDCFTCTANGTKCDRRRPYCGPCLEIGTDCKGYRTQLTWGVGVASRGKLRGMTLPVSIESNISVAERDRKSAVQKKSASIDETVTIKAKKLRNALEMRRLSDASHSNFPKEANKLSIVTNYDFVNMEHPSSAVNADLNRVGFHNIQRSEGDCSVTISSPYSPAMTSSSLMVTSAYPPAIQQTQQRHDYPSTVLQFHKPSYPHDSMAPQHSPGLLISPAMPDFDRAYSPQEDSPYSISPSPPDSSLYEVGLSTTSAYLPPASAMAVTSTMAAYTPILTTAHPESHLMENVNLNHQHRSQQWQLAVPYLAHLAPELRFLIDYYDKTVCPSMVAFDGPTNPYRTHILRLAFQNEALMEAVYALASSHLQQRKKTPLLETRRSSPPRFSSRSSSSSHHSPTSRGDHSSTSSALRHKNASIKFLNNQLADSSLAVTDSAMATLLILCLYHICETGIGQFRTHLAGVKKLMGMRCVGKETGRWGWMETVFTWFDNMSASVNNREAQLRGGYLDMIAETTDDWDLESLTGCDRSLFMRLAGLGRINMLSQQFPTNIYNSTYRQSPIDDDDAEPVRNENDGRGEFWAAWNAMKSDLIAWKPCANPIRKSSKAHEAVEKNHWLHASNVYRYAAILYLDRLAYPHLPSSHHVFQNTVREVLDHLNCIPTTSGLSKSLMWPIFITGTECVVDEHRMLIRDRCFEMQKDCGFFNKVAGLDVLETIWDQETDDDGFYGYSSYVEPGSESIGGRGLKWRKVTQKEDGEYLMI